VSDADEESAADAAGEQLHPETRDLAAEVTPEEARDSDAAESGPRKYGSELTEVDVDPETARAFWTTLLYVNVGLLLVALGPMLAVFRGRGQVGSVLAVLGAVALSRAYTVYRGYTTDGEAATGSGTSDAETDTDWD
jgi:hypothetical protein